MTQAQEFDPHAAIGRLAEIEWPCKTIQGWVKQTGEHPDAIPIDPDEHPEPCCGGTGRSVPFQKLRTEGCLWVPEPDVEKACWRIFETHPAILRDMIEQGEDGPYVEYEMKEALLRAALAWAQEQQKEAQ